MYLLMLRCLELERAAARRRTTKGSAREALLAATAMQLMPGDLLCSEPGDATAEELAPKGKDPKVPGMLAPMTGARLAVCAAAARGLTAAGSNGLVLAYVRAGVAEAGWAETLAWAHEQRVPLIVVCEDAVNGGSGKKPGVVSWPGMQSVVKKLRLPILAVDGADAVAVYRVMQESVIRARHNDGPAVIWAVTSQKTTKLPRSQQPLGRLQSYLKVRSIPIPKPR
jgi:pyruvate dehydrogenase E1 component alpha subunit